MWAGSVLYWQTNPTATQVSMPFSVEQGSSSAPPVPPVVPTPPVVPIPPVVAAPAVVLPPLRPPPEVIVVPPVAEAPLAPALGPVAPATPPVLPLLVSLMPRTAEPPQAASAAQMRSALSERRERIATIRWFIAHVILLAQGSLKGEQAFE